MAVVALGAAFQKFCHQVTHAAAFHQVTQAMEKNTNIELKQVLGNLEAKFNSLRDKIIQPIQQGHQIFDNQNDKIESIVVELHKGAKLVAKVTKLGSWSYYLLDEDEYIGRLLKLDWYLKTLLRTTQDRALFARAFDAYKKKAGTVPLTAEKEAALVVFRRLFAALIEAEEKEKREAPPLFRFLVSDIRSKMYWLLLQPFLMHQQPELFTSSFRAEMEKGVEVVRRSGGVGKKWEGYSKKKYECIDGLLGLNQCLQRQVCILRWQMAKNAIQALDLVRKMERAVNEIESNVGVLEQAGVASTS